MPSPHYISTTYYSNHPESNMEFFRPGPWHAAAVPPSTETVRVYHYTFPMLLQSSVVNARRACPRGLR